MSEIQEKDNNVYLALKKIWKGLKKYEQFNDIDENAEVEDNIPEDRDLTY